jgi:transcription initiation factor TFIID/TFIIF subunit
MEGYPMRQWSIEIWLLDEQGNEVMPNVFEKATYNLHPTFERNKQSAFGLIILLGACSVLIDGSI